MFLEPGEQLNYNTQNKICKIQNVRVEDVIAWRDGVLIFNKTLFSGSRCQAPDAGLMPIFRSPINQL